MVPEYPEYWVLDMSDVPQAGPFESWAAAEQWADKQEDPDDLYIEVL